MGALYTSDDARIGVQSATFGDNCTSTGYVDVTLYFAGSCNQVPSCSVNLSAQTLAAYSGPAGCTPQLTVQWACWDGAHIQTVADTSQAITLSCP
jgi:hypothetical protein